jgi:hypothetical protein
MRQSMVVAGVAGALVLAGTAGASLNAANVRIDFRHSNCLQLQDLRLVRFFVQLVNTGDSAGALRADVHFTWLRAKGGRKDSLNVLKGGQLGVGAHSRKLYYIELRADPTQRITACGVRIGNSSTVHRIGVLVSAHA